MEAYNSWRTALTAGGVAARMTQLIRGLRGGVAHKFITSQLRKLERDGKGNYRGLDPKLLMEILMMNM